MNRHGIDPKRRAKPLAHRDDPLDASDGNREQLLGALRECFGISNSEAEYRFRQCLYATEAELDVDAEPSSRPRLH